MESRAAICGGTVEVESRGERDELGLSGEGTRGRDHWTGLKTIGSKVGLRFAGRLLKSSGRTGKPGRGMIGGAGAGDWGGGGARARFGAAVDWTPAEVGVGVGVGVVEVEEGIGTVKRGVMDRESFRTRGRSGVNVDSDTGSDTGSEAGCSGEGEAKGAVGVGSADSADVGSSTGN